MNPTHAKPKKLFSWRLLYAFMVVWLSAFTLLSPLARREALKFQSTAQIQYALNPQRQLSSDELLSLLRSVVSEVTQPNTLGQIRDNLGTAPIGIARSGLALGTDDVSDIRRRLSISQEKRDDGLRLAISFQGKGTSDEQEFVNQLANLLALEVPRNSDRLAIAQLMKANNEHLDMSKQINLAEQIRAEVAQINESIAELKLHVSNGEAESLSDQLQNLEKLKAELKENQKLDDSHPQMVQVQQQIEGLRTAILSDPNYRPVQIGAAPTTDSLDVIKNRFYQASAKTVAESPSKIQWSEAFATIDLSRIGAIATQLKTNAESVHDLKHDVDATLTSRFQTAAQSFANLSSVRYSTSPTVLATTGATPLWLLIIPCLIGALVAMHYNPVSDRMQLKSMGDVARAMHLNVIGELPASSTASLPSRSERWSARSVRTAEYALIAVGFVLFASCAIKPQMFALALTNPLLALSSWFWMIVG